VVGGPRSLGSWRRSWRGTDFILKLLERLERGDVARSKISRLQVWVYQFGVHEHSYWLPSGWVSLRMQVLPLPERLDPYMFFFSLSSSVLNVADRDDRDILPVFAASHELGHLFPTLRHQGPRGEPYREPDAGTCALFREELRASNFGCDVVRGSRSWCPIRHLFRSRWSHYPLAAMAMYFGTSKGILFFAASFLALAALYWLFLDGFLCALLADPSLWLFALLDKAIGSVGYYLFLVLIAFIILGITGVCLSNRLRPLKGD
jgi:hypothetical protein